MARVLMHVCCGPCSLMPIKHLQEEGHDVTAFFFNPNIHPQEEYALRMNAMRQAADFLNVPLLVAGEAVHPQTWVTALGAETAEGVRCRSCYRVRLNATAELANTKGFAFFTSSLLYSRYQHHDAIIAEAEAAGVHGSVAFLYRDFRFYWQEGIDKSKEIGLYRQKWCGCTLSKGEAEAQREQKRKEKEGRPK